MLQADTRKKSTKIELKCYKPRCGKKFINKTKKYRENRSGDSPKRGILLRNSLCCFLFLMMLPW